ncbi:MAG: flippase-like domain-containing protein [Bacteroidales bacterium]|jgi:MFS family permease|nr:flippase-like domain-containing protein [Bacteroidales bacterium]
MKNQSKIRKIANLTIQLLILCATFGFIYKQVVYKNDVAAILKNFEGEFSKPGFVKGMILMVLLMIINWGIEAWKWEFLIGKIEKVSFIKAFQAVLSGVSISSFTPNRIGEFFGRVFILEKASHIEGILITVLGSMSQLLITILAGSLSLLVFIPNYLSDTVFSHGYLYYSLVAIVLSFDVLILGLFFNVSFLSSLKEKILKNGLKKLRKFFRIFSFYHNKEIGKVILLSFLRYGVFSFQFFLLLRLFGVAIPFFQAQVLISLLFFIMAVVPTIALTEIGIRGSVAIYIFGLYFSRVNPSHPGCTLCIFAASTLLWLINVGVPALIGSLFLFRLQFFRNRK